MTGTEGLAELLRSHGLILLFPLVLVEGPVATVAAGWLARLHQLELVPVALTCIVADVVGDLAFYGIGRSGRRLSARLRERIDGDGPRRAALRRRFAERGGRTLLLGKFTWAAGLAVILVAGAARMPLPAFVGFSVLGTVPKALLLIAAGWWLGTAWDAAGAWIGWGSVSLAALATAFWWARHRRAARE